MTSADLATLGHHIATDAHARLDRFVGALLDENSRHNLTATRDAPGVWRRHVCDAFALLPLLDAEQPARLLDVGSGGGLPGVPLACVRPELHVTLLDSTRKKIDATTRIAVAAGLQNVRCIWGRAESLAHEVPHREQFDLVTARAVASLDQLVELCAAFARVGGACVFPKSQQGVAAELPAALPIARRCGLADESTHAYRLPDGSTDRVLVIFRKRSPTPPDLPRDGSRIGTPIA
ncbi:MAG: 16S rRNA (guanine(527)-N(7))-methyltransferase RsmG [Phycisphaerae bacterium]